MKAYYVSLSCYEIRLLLLLSLFYL